MMDTPDITQMRWTRKVLRKFGRKFQHVWFLLVSTHFEQSSILSRYSLMVISGLMGFTTFFTTRNGLHYFLSDVQLKTRGGSSNTEFLVYALNGVIDYIGGISTLIAIAVESILVFSAWNIGLDNNLKNINKKFVTSYIFAFSISLFFSIVSLVSGALHSDSERFVRAEWGRLFEDARSVASDAIKEASSPTMNSATIAEMRERLKKAYDIAEKLHADHAAIEDAIARNLTKPRIQSAAQGNISRIDSRIATLNTQVSAAKRGQDNLRSIEAAVNGTNRYVFNSRVIPYYAKHTGHPISPVTTRQEMARHRNTVNGLLSSDMTATSLEIANFNAELAKLDEERHAVPVIDDQTINAAKESLSSYIKVNYDNHGDQYKSLYSQINEIEKYDSKTIDAAGKLTNSLCDYSNRVLKKVSGFNEYIQEHIQSEPLRVVSRDTNNAQGSYLAGLQTEYNDACIAKTRAENPASKIELKEKNQKDIAAKCEEADDDTENPHKKFRECLDSIKKIAPTGETRNSLRDLAARANNVDYMLTEKASPITRLVGAWRLGIPSMYIGIMISLVLSLLPLVCAMAIKRFSVNTQLANAFLPPEGVEATLRANLQDPTSSSEYADLIVDILGMDVQPQAGTGQKVQHNFSDGLIIPEERIAKYAPLFCSLIASGNATLMAQAASGSGTIVLRPAMVAWLQEQLMAARFAKKFD